MPKVHKPHGMSYTPLWHVWLQMKGRCKNKRNKNYHYYGGRGIKVCEEWDDDFMTFHDWSMAHGYAKGLQIDRWPDKNGHYEPSNCRWTTQLENKQNTRKNVLIEYNGETKCLSEWSRQFGISHHAIAARWRAGVRGELLFSKKRFYYRENSRYAHRIA